MTTATIGMDVELSRVDCGECGGVYALTKRYHDQKREKGGYWTCPYCKSGWGFGEGERDRLRKQVEEERRRAAAAEGRVKMERARAAAAERSANAYKGQVTKVKKRVANGVCPCCNRSFKNLHDHMQTKHPDWAPVDAHGVAIRHRGGPWYNIVRLSDGVELDYVRGKARAEARRREIVEASNA